LLVQARSKLVHLELLQNAVPQLENELDVYVGSEQGIAYIFDHIVDHLLRHVICTQPAQGSGHALGQLSEHDVASVFLSESRMVNAKIRTPGNEKSTNFKQEQNNSNKRSQTLV
jgi:hypothetical protein